MAHDTLNLSESQGACLSASMVILYTIRMLTKQIKRFIRLEATGGLLLFIALFIALGLANSPLNAWYQSLIDAPMHIKLGYVGLEKPAFMWVNEGFMALFFLLLTLMVSIFKLHKSISFKIFSLLKYFL